MMNTIRQELYDTWRRPIRTCLFPAALILVILNALGNQTASAQEACCFPDGTCTDVSTATCAASGGTAHGAGSQCATSICPASTDCSAPGVAIPDNNAAGVDDTITVAGGGEIVHVRVYVRISHTFVGDLIMTLEHVDTGTTVIIYDRPGAPATTYGCATDNIEVILDDDAIYPVEGECSAAPSAIFGSFTPNNPLSAFEGEDRAGMWTLNVSDNASADTGMLVEWCVAPLLDTDGDGVYDPADVCPGFADNLDADGDGVPDGCDLCVGDDAIGDSDGDGVCDDLDDCSDDPGKSNPGACGCGTPDDDSDGDSVPDCFDACPDDPNKLQPGLCGCGNGDVDSDGDGWLDCFDNCPLDSNPLQQDGDGDGIGDACPPPAAGNPCAPPGMMMTMMPMTLLGLGLMRRRRRKTGRRS